MAPGVCGQGAVQSSQLSSLRGASVAGGLENTQTRAVS